jgi:hypothetical protein
MKRFMFTAVIFACMVLMTSVAGSAEKTTIEGKFAGANCMFFNKTCPIGMSEGHIATEPDFVVAMPDGKFYYVVNIDRAIKARHLNDDVRVTGSLNGNSMKADSLELKTDGKYVHIWSLSDEMKERAELTKTK